VRASSKGEGDRPDRAKKVENNTHKKGKQGDEPKQ